MMFVVACCSTSSVVCSASTVTIENNGEIFNLFVLASANGYDYENAKEVSKARWIAKKYVLTHKERCSGILDKFKAEMSGDEYYSNAMHTILSHDGNVLKKKKILSLLGEFRECAQLDRLRHTLNNEYNAELEYYREHIQELLSFVQDSLNVPSNFWPKHIVIVPNLLDAYYRGYNVRNEEESFIVIGPGKSEQNLITLLHELIHILFYSQITASIKTCSSISNGFEAARGKYPLINSGYGDLNTYLAENMVIALEIYLAENLYKRNPEQLVTNYRKKRFIYLAPLLLYLDENKITYDNISSIFDSFWNSQCDDESKMSEDHR